MTKFQRPDGNPVPNVHVAEFTTPQLVLYLCLVLCGFALVFGLGVITGRLDPSYKNTKDGAKLAENVVTETYSEPVTTGDASAGGKGAAKITADGAQRTPETPTPRNPYMKAAPGLTFLEPLNSDPSRPIQIEAPSKVASPEAKSEGEPSTTATLPNVSSSAPQKSSEQKTPPVGTASEITENTPTPSAAASTTPAPSTTTTPPDPTAASPASSAPATPTPAANSETSTLAAPASKTADTQAPPSKQTASAAKPDDIPLLTPLTPEEPPIKDLPMEPVPSEPPAKPAPKAAEPGHYGIQLAAFTEADRRTRADSLLQKLKKDTGLHIQVLPASDGSVYRVIVGGYADKESATKALPDVRAKTGFPQAFIKAL